MNSGPKAPVFYVYITSAALIISLVLVFLAGQVDLNWQVFVKSNNPLLPIIGYLLSPFVPIICLVFLRNKDNQFRSNIYYDIGKGRTLLKIAGVLSFLGFVIGILHIVRIAYVLQGL